MRGQKVRQGPQFSDPDQRSTLLIHMRLPAVSGSTSAEPPQIQTPTDVPNFPTIAPPTTCAPPWATEDPQPIPSPQ